MYAEYRAGHSIIENSIQLSLLLLGEDKEIGKKYFCKINGRNLLQFFIEQHTTHSLGYEPIRKMSVSETSAENDTYEDLVRRLGEMDKRILESEFRVSIKTSMNLFNCLAVLDEGIKEVLAEVSRLVKKLEKVKSCS